MKKIKIELTTATDTQKNVSILEKEEIIKTKRAAKAALFNHGLTLYPKP